MCKIISLAFIFGLASAPAFADDALKGSEQDKDAGTVEDILQSPAEDTLNAPAGEVLDAPVDEGWSGETNSQDQQPGEEPTEETIVPEESSDAMGSATQETILPLEPHPEADSEPMQEDEDPGMF